MQDIDQEYRIALFAHIAQLRDAGSGVVPAAALNQGMQFRGGRVPVWNQQQGIYKPAILGRDGAAVTIQTSYDSPYDDGADRDGARFIYRYRGANPDHRDNRALRRVFELGRPLLYLVGLRPGLYQAEFPFYVVADHPGDLAFELMTDVKGALEHSFGRDPLENEPLKAYATRTVRQRLHQQRFRYLVLGAYGDQCTMCRLRHSVLLDAAHILPDREDQGRPEVQNGLSLCKIHHSAYDAGIVGVAPDHRIHLRADILSEIDGPMLRHGLQELHGQHISPPRSPSLHPRREYLAERFHRFLAA